MVDFSNPQAAYPSIAHETKPLVDAFPVVMQQGEHRSTTMENLRRSLVPNIQKMSGLVVAALLTDGGGASGTAVSTETIPAGAIILGSKVIVGAGFAGNVSATLQLGDGSDPDRYNTGTPSVFATAANGIETGAPSGSKLQTTAGTVTATITSSSDIGLVIADGTGFLGYDIYYIVTNLPIS